MENKSTSKYFWFIELVAYWQGQINSRELCDNFGISVTQAKKYITHYRDYCPTNLAYCKSTKAHLAQDSFQQQYISGDVSEYLDWLNGLNEGTVLTANSITHANLRLPARTISPNIMRALVSAVKSKRRVDVDYVSLSKTTEEGRVIQPHTFVKTGLRWHLRGYCEYRGEFRDFVLSRFRGEPTLMGKATHFESDDSGWNTEVSLRIQPDPRFSKAQRTIIEQDYKMRNGELVIKSKPALAQYLLQEMHVRTEFLAKTPQQQQLVLVNESDVKEWLFGN